MQNFWIQDFFSLNSWQNKVGSIQLKAPKLLLWYNTIISFSQAQLHSYPIYVLDPSTERQNSHLELCKARTGNLNHFLF